MWYPKVGILGAGNNEGISAKVSGRLKGGGNN
jgi:hypothetical protein